MKTYYTQANIGHAKYVVNYYDGVKTHDDGSPFFNIAIFHNNESKRGFIKELIRQGYTEKTTS